MSTYFVPTRFIWRFGGQVVSHNWSICADPMDTAIIICRISVHEGPPRLQN